MSIQLTLLLCHSQIELVMMMMMLTIRMMIVIGNGDLGGGFWEGDLQLGFRIEDGKWGFWDWRWKLPQGMGITDQQIEVSRLRVETFNFFSFFNTNINGVNRENTRKWELSNVFVFRTVLTILVTPTTTRLNYYYVTARLD